MNTIYLAIHIFGLQKAIYQLHYTRLSMASVCIKTEFTIVLGEEEQWWRAILRGSWGKKKKKAMIIVKLLSSLVGVHLASCALQ